MKAQGNAEAATQEEFKQRYDSFVNGLSEGNKLEGKTLVDSLLNLETLNARLDTAKNAIDKTGASQSSLGSGTSGAGGSSQSADSQEDPAGHHARRKRKSRAEVSNALKHEQDATKGLASRDHIT